MRKIFSILLAFVLLYTIIGFYVDFKIEQFILKREIKEKIIVSLPDKELTLIKVTSENIKNIKWTENGEEFRYRDKMYDIARTKIINGTKYYYCFDDKNENKLITSVDKLIKEQMNHSKSKNTNKKPLINYFCHMNTFSHQSNERTFNFLELSQKYYSLKPDIISPPPKPAIS